MEYPKKHWLLSFEKDNEFYQFNHLQVKELSRNSVNQAIVEIVGGYATKEKEYSHIGNILTIPIEHLKLGFIPKSHFDFFNSQVLTLASKKYLDGSNKINLLIVVFGFYETLELLMKRENKLNKGIIDEKFIETLAFENKKKWTEIKLITKPGFLLLYGEFSEFYTKKYLNNKKVELTTIQCLKKYGLEIMSDTIERNSYFIPDKI